MVNQMLNKLKSQVLALSSCVMLGAMAETGVLLNGEVYRVSVDPDTVSSRAALALVWDAADRGGNYQAWANKRVITDNLTAAGGVFETSAEGVAGAVVKAVVFNGIALGDDRSGYVWLKNNQYLDTGIRDNTAYGFDIGFTITGQSETYSSVISGTLDKFTVGTYAEISNGTANWSRTSMNYLYLRFQGNGYTPYNDPNCVSGAINRMLVTNRVWTANDVAINSALPAGSVYNDTATISLSTHAGHNNRFTYAKWYWAKIFGSGNVVLCDLVPARRLPEGTGCFYDRASRECKYPVGGGAVETGGEFSTTNYTVIAISDAAEEYGENIPATALWTNAGGDGKLTNAANWSVKNALGGSVAGALPTDHTRVTITGTTFIDFAADETLNAKSVTLDAKLSADSQWSGTIVHPYGQRLNYLDLPKNAYVDTGFCPNEKTRVVMDVTVLNNGAEYWFGCWDGNWTTGAFAVGMDIDSKNSNMLYLGYGNNYVGGGTVPNPSKGRHLFDYQGGVLKIDGNIHASVAYNQPFQLVSSIYLAAQNRIGVATPQTSQVKIRIHSCKIYDDGGLVRDFIPVKRADDLGYAFYEQVSRTIYPVLGGSPVAGPIQAGLPEGAAVDLAGNDLSMQFGEDIIVDASEITDSIGGGCFRASVENGASCDNQAMRFTGGVRLVKEGEGTFVASVGNHSYTGGTEVASGTLKAGVLCSGVTPLGANQSVITIDRGATWDFDGFAGYSNYRFVLAGGLMKSITQRGYDGWAWLSDVELTADSEMSGYNFGFVNSSYSHITVDLHGHTLTLGTGTSGNGNEMFFVANTTFTGGGMVEFTSGGLIVLGRNVAPIVFDEGVSFRYAGTSGWLHLASEGLSVENFFVERTGNDKYYQGGTVDSCSMKVTGTMTIADGGRFPRVILQNGSTLDLSAVNGTLDTVIQYTSGWSNDLNITKVGAIRYADNATVKVALGERWHGFASDSEVKVLNWGSAYGVSSVPQSGVGFELEDGLVRKYCSLRQKADGLYLWKSRGTTMIMK